MPFFLATFWVARLPSLCGRANWPRERKSLESQRDSFWDQVMGAIRIRKSVLIVWRALAQRGLADEAMASRGSKVFTIDIF